MTLIPHAGRLAEHADNLRDEYTAKAQAVEVLKREISALRSRGNNGCDVLADTLEAEVRRMERRLCYLADEEAREIAREKEANGEWVSPYVSLEG